MSILFLLIVSSSICLSFGETESEYISQVKASVEKCRKDFNIEKDTVNALMKAFVVPETDDGKCMMACALKEMKLFNDGKFNAEEFISPNTGKWEKKEDTEKADAVYRECFESVGTDVGENECEYAYNLMSCIAKAAIKENLPSWGMFVD